MMGRPVGWILDPTDRNLLLDRFPPAYEKTIAHHVTLWGHGNGGELPEPAEFSVIGRADDGRGIEALVVAVNGNHDRPDGSTYHCTWSLDPASGCRPKHSNDLIAEAGWTALDQPITFSATPGKL